MKPIKIKDHIHTQVTGTKRIVGPSLMDIKVEELPVTEIPFEEAIEHRTEVRLGKSFYAKNAEEAEYLKLNVTESIMDFLYGDLREGLRDALRHAYTSGNRELAEKLQEILKETH